MPTSATSRRRKSVRRPAGPPALLWIGSDPGRLADVWPGLRWVAAPNLLQALLEATPESPFDLLVLEISGPSDQLQPGVQQLRKAYPQARLVLLAEVIDEPLCRQALLWGATDYRLRPFTADQLRQEIEKVTDDAPTVARRAAAESTPLPAVPTLSLEQQLPLLQVLLEEAGNVQALALEQLQASYPWGGTLAFAAHDPALPPPTSTPHREPVRLGDELLGTLTLHVPPETPPARHLPQAAAWLAAVLAVAQRADQLHRMAITDELSGAYNRRYFLPFVARLLERAKAEGSQVTLLLFDLDNFKQYNDSHGHAAGDAVLRETVRLIRHCTRPHDLVARLGGDEFAVVFWDAEPPRLANSRHPGDAVEATKRFRKAIETHTWRSAAGIAGQVSISGGLASFPRDADTVEGLMAVADAALLQAKARGKNVVVLHE